MLRRLRYIGRVISLFFRLFIFRSAAVLFKPEPPPAPAPPVVRRAEKTQRLRHAVFYCVVLMLPYVTVRLTKGNRYTAYYPPSAIALLCAIDVLLTRWLGGASRTLLREAKQNEYALCPDCGYCLIGLPDRHQCPECGTAYNIEEVKRKWSEYLADRAARQLPW